MFSFSFFSFSQLAAPLLNALTLHLQSGHNDVRYLEWVRALLQEHRNALSNEESSLEALRAVSDRAAHSLKRLLKLKGKLELLEYSSVEKASSSSSSRRAAMTVWDEREHEDGVGPMDIESDDSGSSSDGDDSSSSSESDEDDVSSSSSSN